jgi:phage terminase Nu1 subunit (DNA packaging protein)
MDNDNQTGTIHKEGGALIYIMEELTDARLRCEQLKKFVSQAVRLISTSPSRDHFYEIAGDTIYGIPDALFKLDKALAATALAASRLDYEELKTQLKPEKVEELEDVLRNTRLRQIDRRSPFIQPIPEGHPRMATELAIRDINELTENLEHILLEAARLRKSLPPQMRDNVEDIQSLAARSLKKIKHSSSAINTQQGKTASMFRAASTSHIATALRRIADEIQSARIPPHVASIRVRRVLMALSQTSQQALEAMGPIQAGSREEVMKGFKSANPDLSEEQLNEIADQWEKNKDVVKNKHK